MRHFWKRFCNYEHFIARIFLSLLSTSTSNIFSRESLRILSSYKWLFIVPPPPPLKLMISSAPQVEFMIWIIFSLWRDSLFSSVISYPMASKCRIFLNSSKIFWFGHNETDMHFLSSTSSFWRLNSEEYFAPNLLYRF